MMFQRWDPLAYVEAKIEQESNITFWRVPNWSWNIYFKG